MKERKGEHPYGDEGQIIALVVFAVVWVTDTYFLNATTFLSNDVPETIRHTVVALFAAMAFLLFFSSRVVIRGERSTEVVTNRAFRYVRHPIYLAAMFGYFAAAFSSLSLVSLALLVPIFILYNYLATYEEKLLEMKFGAKYREYEEKTGKWLPKVR